MKHNTMTTDAANELRTMNAIVKMTGLHWELSLTTGKPRLAWNVAVFSTEDNHPKSTIYKVLNYTRAVSLSCNMARDRRLFLHLEAFPY